MAGKHVVSALERKYAELCGEKDALARDVEGTTGAASWDRAVAAFEVRAAEIATALAHLTYVIRLFDQNWSSRSVKPIAPRQQRLIEGRGSVATLAKTILREERGEAFSATDIIHKIEQRLERHFDTQERSKLASSVTGALHRAAAKGRCEEIPGRPIRWRSLSEASALPPA